MSAAPPHSSSFAGTRWRTRRYTGLKTAPAPTFVSTVKIKQAGFTQVLDTEECVKHWLSVLIERKILPDLTRA